MARRSHGVKNTCAPAAFLIAPKQNNPKFDEPFSVADSMETAVALHCENRTKPVFFRVEEKVKRLKGGHQEHGVFPLER